VGVNKSKSVFHSLFVNKGIFKHSSLSFLTRFSLTWSSKTDPLLFDFPLLPRIVLLVPIVLAPFLLLKLFGLSFNQPLLLLLQIFIFTLSRTVRPPSRSYRCILRQCLWVQMQKPFRFLFFSFWSVFLRLLLGDCLNFRRIVAVGVLLNVTKHEINFELGVFSL
jgi:hypothetical protein